MNFEDNTIQSDHPWVTGLMGFYCINQNKEKYWILPRINTEAQYQFMYVPS